jgi:proteasome component ECM29
MALKYANAIYPFSCVFARYICLLGSASSISKLEVKEESARGLLPFVRNKSGLVENVEVVPFSELPRFSELVHYIYNNKPTQEYSLNSKSPVIKGYPVEVYSEMLSFLRMVFILEANPNTILLDDYVSSKVDNGMAEDPVVMTNFKQCLLEMWDQDKQTIECWLQFVEQGLDITLKGNHTSHFVLMYTKIRHLFP